MLEFCDGLLKTGDDRSDDDEEMSEDEDNKRGKTSRQKEVDKYVEVVEKLANLLDYAEHGEQFKIWALLADSLRFVSRDPENRLRIADIFEKKSDWWFKQNFAHKKSIMWAIKR